MQALARPYFSNILLTAHLLTDFLLALIILVGLASAADDARPAITKVTVELVTCVWGPATWQGVDRQSGMPLPGPRAGVLQ